MAKGKEIVTTSKPWDYETAVSTGRSLVKIYNKVTLDLVRELWSAREALSIQGARLDLTSRQIVGKLSPWEQYCEDIGLSTRTAQRWLQFYEPETDKLLTPEEFKAKKILEFESWIKKLNPKFPEWRPEEWPKGCEEYYQSKQKVNLLDQIAKRTKFEQLDLFDANYYDDLTTRIKYTSADDVVHFSTIQKKIEPVAYPGIPLNRQAHAFLIIEKVLQDFPEEERKNVAKALADMTRLYAEEEM